MTLKLICYMIPTMVVDRQQQYDFLETLWNFYARHARNLPWREPEADGTFDAYKIMVSELMLQQTQVGRVIPKYEAFVDQFPNVSALAEAELGTVLHAWQGLGYNRRAKFLWQAARMVAMEAGSMPVDAPALTKLPGIGINTAGAILAYAYNQPAVFIETNVRTVYIHHFFADVDNVPDTAIRNLVAETLDLEHPREFYWALMDYGSHLKSIIGNVNTASKHYTKQSKFEGSRRQIRGRVIRLLASGSYSTTELGKSIPDERLVDVLSDLTAEGLVRVADGVYSL